MWGGKQLNKKLPSITPVFKNLALQTLFSPSREREALPVGGGGVPHVNMSLAKYLPDALGLVTRAIDATRKPVHEVGLSKADEEEAREGNAVEVAGGIILADAHTNHFWLIWSMLALQN